jgi:predicted membrane-bound spermidine synthase
MYVFPTDMERVESKVNTLNDQVLVNTFTEEWAKYSR